MQNRERQFEQLFHSEYGRMYRAAYILLGDEDEAKDAVQDVFARLWDGSVALREESQRSFLLTCVRNRCLNIIAQRRRLSLSTNYMQETTSQLATDHSSAIPSQEVRPVCCVANATHTIPSGESEPYLEMSDDELTDMVQQYIDDRLTPQTGRVIRMRFDDEKSYKDISRSLGISLSAVNKHIVQGLRKLRQQFNQ